MALNYFHRGEPRFDADLIQFLLVAHNPSDATIGKWIDMLKRRQERKPTVNLDETSRAEVRELRGKGVKVKQLSKRFEVSEATIKRICRN